MRKNWAVDAMSLNLCILAVTAAATWLLSLPTNDTSWVDRIWSIVPIAYAWVWASAGGFTDPRLVLMAGLITLWGARLTFNFARKGGYRPGGEDYRWPVLRQRMTRWQFQLFNLVFIVVIQNGILFAITLPMAALSRNAAPFGASDVLLSALFLGFLVLETVADQQQWNFQQRKAAAKAAGVSFGRGFLDSGLFALSRHPNYFAEQAQWWVVFCFSALNVGLQWYTIIGVVALCVLFIGSARFTEELSLAKYPEYADYQRRVSAVVPWLARRKAMVSTRL